ncbi:MAG: hypothetical protein K8S15_05075 [Candidatus Aegiribacteria sp.]|nr:hypothetical protein [Candidatus Aegiribacteria sp.]
MLSPQYISAGTFTEEVLGANFCRIFNSKSGEIGVMFALMKYSYEIFHGDDDANARLNLSGNLLQYSLGRWGWQGVKIANIGIFLINYSLTEFAERAFHLLDLARKDQNNPFPSLMISSC